MNLDEITQLGASLRRISHNLRNDDAKSGILRIWYQGEEPYFDLFIELKNEEISWFQLTLRGKAVFWEQSSDHWQTGNTNELHSNDLTFYAASKLISSSDRLDQDFLDLVATIIATRSGEAIFDQLLALFKQQKQSILS